MKSIPARVLATVVGAVLFVGSFPPCGWRLLILPALMLLFVSIEGLRLRAAFWIAFIHGMIAYGLAVSWFWNIFQATALGLYAILALFTGAFAVAQSLASRRGGSPWLLGVFTAINWSGWEFIRAELFTLCFPWMTPGVALGPNALLPWIGVYGVSFFVVLATAFVIRAGTRRAGLALCVIIAALCLWPPGGVKLDQPNAIRVAALQYEAVSIDVYLHETAKLDPTIPLVLWPEESVPYDVRANKADMKAVQDLARQPQRVIILGTQTRPTPDHWFNTALTLGPDGVLGEHYKIHPVHLFDDGTPGTTALPVKTPLGTIGTPICFDCDYEGVVRKMTAAGAEFFAVPSMDAESWGAKQHWQHAELFRLRACENGRWMLVCPSSGMSQIIDPHGHGHAMLEPMKQGVLTGALNRETRLTFYTRFGWLMSWCLLAAAVVSWIALLMPRRAAM